MKTLQDCAFLYCQLRTGLGIRFDPCFRKLVLLFVAVGGGEDSSRGRPSLVLDIEEQLQNVGDETQDCIASEVGRRYRQKRETVVNVAVLSKSGLNFKMTYGFLEGSSPFIHP
jgi:hypothetical protein